ncbi:hypothetical protein H8959_010755 [Pygathrix nigripes]
MAAAAGRLRAERKPRAQTGRGGWCERLGPLPARRGWNTMSRAGGRAGEREREQPDSAAGSVIARGYDRDTLRQQPTALPDFPISKSSHLRDTCPYMA